MHSLQSFAVNLVLGMFVTVQIPQTGVVTGAVLDANTGQTIRNARVIADGSGLETVSDIDGVYRLELPAGTYRLRFKAENFSETAVDAVVVMAGRMVEASTVLAGKGTGTTIDVVEKVGAALATAEAMIIERKLAPVVSDAVSSEEIRNTVASDAAGVLEKVTGVSVVDNGYVYVRGLGERYSATMLNNSVLPTTEPERRVVPLDLFPASLIDNIKVLKTYSPDLPGEFSGGLVQIHTVEFPAARMLRVGASNGFNTNTTFKPFDTYRGGGWDFFGFDDGTRSIPRAIPEARLFPGSFDERQFQGLGRSFTANWEPVALDSMRPSQSYSVAAGDTIGRVGLVGAFTFSNSPHRIRELQRYFVVSAGQPVTFTEYPDFSSSSESVRMGGVLNAAVRLSPSNKLILRNTLTRDTDKEARRFTGLNGGIDSVIEATRLRWVERRLLSTSLEGEHAVARLRNSLFRWQMTYSASNRNEPDLREAIRGRREDGTFSFLPLPQSGLRFFNQLNDRIAEPLLEWSTVHYRGSVSGSLKLGYRGTFRNRDFEARRFRFVPVQARSLDFLLPTNELLGAANIRPDAFEIRENTRGTDKYEADMEIHGAFAMADVAFGTRWRLIGGARVEDARITVETVDPLVPGSAPSIARLANRDVLPGANLIYSMTPYQNLRFGYGRTLSRPDFRELSPFDFTNVLGGFNTVGNPNLKRAKIDNYDARWEWFTGGNQVVAASYFLKDFADPIEVTIQPTTDLRQSYINAMGARNHGVEIEFRRNLRLIHDRLLPFSFHANLTVVNSAVEIPGEQALLLTSRKRAMVGQSRYIYNLITEWAKPEWRSAARFYANTVSRRITDVGTFGLPDIYRERNTFLDFVYQYSFGPDGRWSVRFTAENLGNSEHRWTQADLVQRSFRTGRTLSVSASLSIF